MSKPESTLHFWKDKIYRTISWLLPDRLVYWVAIRACGRCTSLEFAASNPNDVSVMDLIERMDKVSK